MWNTPADPTSQTDERIPEGTVSLQVPRILQTIPSCDSVWWWVGTTHNFRKTWLDFSNNEVTLLGSRSMWTSWSSWSVGAFCSCRRTLWGARLFDTLPDYMAKQCQTLTTKNRQRPWSLLLLIVHLWQRLLPSNSHINYVLFIAWRPHYFPFHIILEPKFYCREN